MGLSPECSDLGRFGVVCFGMSNSTTQLETLRASGATVTDYRASARLAKKNPGKPVFSDAGDGWICESTYCARRQRVIRVSIAPSGQRVA